MIEILNEIANSTTLFIVGAWFGLVITIVLIILLCHSFCGSIYMNFTVKVVLILVRHWLTAFLHFVFSCACKYNIFLAFCEIKI